MEPKPPANTTIDFKDAKDEREDLPSQTSEALGQVGVEQVVINPGLSGEAKRDYTMEQVKLLDERAALLATKLVDMDFALNAAVAGQPRPERPARGASREDILAYHQRLRSLPNVESITRDVTNSTTHLRDVSDLWSGLTDEQKAAVLIGRRTTRLVQQGTYDEVRLPDDVAEAEDRDFIEALRAVYPGVTFDSDNFDFYRDYSYADSPHHAEMAAANEVLGRKWLDAKDALTKAYLGDITKQFLELHQS